jgi:hypothetical protein
MMPTSRTTANIYQPISLRAVFNHNGVNQRVIIDTVRIVNSQNKTVSAYGPGDVKQLRDGSYEVLVEVGLPAGEYRDTWTVRGFSSVFRARSQFRFNISSDPSNSKMKEPYS